ncbi:MAG: prepilin-type N-terminal cleavage/methylation domain-containing protein [Desulfohalobiaceae bacterium]|nr:prepilin-type N-terminal cleavage/methylation domain-containing protein [Desulfohalobiaceae bacterium]
MSRNQELDQLKARFSHGSGGFTLLEILVALSITAIAFTVLFTVFSRVAGVAEKVQEQSSLGQVGRTIVLRLGSDLESLYRPSGDEAEKDTNSTLFSGEEPGADLFEEQTVLEFSSTAGLSFDPAFPKRQVNRISYVLSPSENEQELYRLIRQETTHALVGGEERDKQSITLSRSIEAFEIEFFKDEDSLPESNWNRGFLGAEDKGRPASIAVRFTLADKDKSREFASVFFIGKEQDESESGQQ